MASLLVLADYADGVRTLTAGTVIDDTLFDTAQLRASGCALVPLTPAIAAVLPAYRAARGNRPADPDPSDLQALLMGAGAVGGSGGQGEFVFADFGTQDEAQGRYTSWPDLMARLAALQIGAAPTVRLALTTGPFAVPLAGMPPDGWDFRGGWLTSFYGASGAVVLDCAPGVKFDNLFGIGGQFLGNGAVVIKIAPPAGTSFLSFTALPPGGAWITVIGGGSAIDHSTAPGAYMKGPDASTTCVLVAAFSQQNTGLGPPLSGPLLEIGATDGAVLAQFGFGGLPDGALVGGGPGSTLLNIYDASANPNTDNVAVWLPGFTGGGGVIPFTFTLGRFVAYTAGAPADWAGAPPATVDAAINRLGAAVSGLLGGPIP